MLEGVQAEIGEVGRFRVAEDSEQATPVVEAVIVDRRSGMGNGVGSHVSWYPMPATAARADGVHPATR
jgi:hypothetical protein